MNNPIPTIFESLALAGSRVVRAAEESLLPKLPTLGFLPDGVQPLEQPERIQIGPLDV